MLFDQKVRARINISAAGDTIVIASPGAGHHLEIDHINFLASGGANTVTLKDGTTTIADYDLLSAQGFTWDFNNQANNKIILSDNTDFIINLANATKVQGFVLAEIY